MPMPLSATQNSQKSSLRCAVTHLRWSLASELDRVGDQVLEHLLQLVRSAARWAIHRRLPWPALFDGPAQILERPLTTSRQRISSKGLACVVTLENGQQVGDHLCHACSAIHGVTDYICRLCHPVCRHNVSCVVHDQLVDHAQA